MATPEELKGLIEEIDTHLGGDPVKEAAEKIAPMLTTIAQAITTRKSLEHYSQVMEDGLSTLSKSVEGIKKSVDGIKPTQIPEFPEEIRISNLGDIQPPKMVVSPTNFADIITALKSIEQKLETLLSENNKREDDDEEKELVVRGEDVDLNTTYFAQAAPGSKDNQPVWRIKKITQQAGQFKTEYPDGDSSFSFAWSKHDKFVYI